MRPLDDAPSHWAPRLEGAEDQSRQRTIDAKRAPFDSRHPADVEQADGEDVARAVSLADASCREHRRVAAYDRADWLHRAANALESSVEVLVESLVRLIGKPRKFSAAEVRRGPALLRQCTEEVAQMDWENLVLDGVPGAVGLWGVTRREPYGVVAAITPFNAPVNLLLQKVGPAIATGNAVVVKPAPDGAVVALQLAEVFEDALPARLLSVLPGGSELARDLIARPEVRDVSLTGRVAAGEAVRRASGVNPVQLELGSNSEPRVLGRRSRAGGGGDRRCGVRREWAACISAHRVIVEALVLDTFALLFASGARALVVDDPSDRATDLGPLVSEQARRRVARHMEDAETRDAKVVLDGRADHLCVAPVGAPPDALLLCEEVFGPVAAVIEVGSVNEAIAVANNSELGPQASCVTASLATAMRVSEELRARSVWINEPTRFPRTPAPSAASGGAGSAGRARYAMEALSQPKFVGLQPA